MHPGIVNAANTAHSNSFGQSDARISSGEKVDTQALTQKAKRCGFQAMLLASTPTSAGGALWIVEQTIIWLQVQVEHACKRSTRC